MRRWRLRFRSWLCKACVLLSRLNVWKGGLYLVVSLIALSFLAIQFEK